MKDRKYCNLYIASCEREGGIYQYRFNEDGICQYINFTQVDRPMYMVIDNNKMYIVLREPWDNEESGVVVYDIDKDGMLVNPSPIMSTKGKVGCHIMVDQGDIYCANYISGNFIRLPDMLVQHSGKGANPVRQEKSHVHYVGMTPDGEYICVSDLGLDTVFLYNKKDLKLYSRAKVPSGHGPRHLVFSEDGRYLFVANELASSVAAFSYHAGKLQLLDIESVVPAAFNGETTASAIRIHNGYLYVSNRGHDTVTKMAFENDKFSVIDYIDCCGETPRDFVFMDHYLVCANQDSDSVAILDENRIFGVREQLKINKPICVCCTE